MSVENNYSWWENALAGKRGPIHPDQCESGYYRSKNRDKTYSAWAYWKDSATGEQRCHANGKEVDPMRAAEQFPFCSKNPITEDAYFAFLETREWADNDAGAAAVAKGPEIDPVADPVGSMKAEIETARAGLDAYKVIESDESAAKGQTLRSALTALAGKAEKARKALKQPSIDEGKRIDAEWTPLSNAAQAGADAIRKALNDWEDIKRANQRRADAENAKAAATSIEPSAPVAPNTPPPSTIIKGASGRAASVSVEHIVVIDDETKAFAFLKGTPELTEILQKLATRSFKAGRLPDGCHTVEKSNVK